MVNILHLMPSLEFDEMSYVQVLVKDLSEEQTRQFATIYNSRRKNSQNILLLTLLGLPPIFIAGIQRFILDQIGMGLLYLFTCGFCFVGTIVDLVNHKSLTLEYNQKIARQVAGMVAAT